MADHGWEIPDQQSGRTGKTSMSRGDREARQFMRKEGDKGGHERR